MRVEPNGAGTAGRVSSLTQLSETPGVVQAATEPASLEGARIGLISVHTSPLAQAGSGDSGGLNVAVRELGRHLVRHGAEVDVFTRATGEDLPPTIATPDGLRVHHVDAGPPALAKHELANHLCAFYLSLSAHPRTAGLDLVHAHYWMSGWVARRLRDRRGVPFVQTFHTLARAKNAALAPGDAPEPALRIAAEERIVADADAIIAPTDDEAALLRARYGAAPGQVQVNPLGVDTEMFSPDDEERERTRAALGVDGPLVVFAGRLQLLKGPDIAVRGLAALRARVPDARLVIVGGASGSGTGAIAPADLRALAEEVGVADRVAILAPRPQAELAALYRAADAILMPSRSESFGLVALEAQACGTPVVASDVGGLRAAVAEGGGALVASHDPARYAQALAPLLSDAGRRAAARRAGVAHALRFGWDRASAATACVYADVLSGRTWRSRHDQVAGSYAGA